MLELISAFMAALPELMKLIKEIQESQRQGLQEESAKEIIKKVHQSFKDKNAEALNKMSNRESDT